MEIKDLVDLIEKQGIKGALIILLIFSLYKFANGKWLSDKLSKVSDWFIEKFIKSKVSDVEKSVRKINTSDIDNHDVFNYIDFWTYSKVPTFQFSTEYRTAVFRKYLTIYLKNYKKNIEIFIKDKAYDTMDEPQILNSFLNLINIY